MFNYTEFNKLVDMCVNDAVIHASSYGHSHGLLETWEDYRQEDVLGFLNAEEVFAIWEKNMAEA